MTSSPVSTSSGPVIGIPALSFPGVTAYKGIPYAADTGGENRWRLPRPPLPWSEPRVCDHFGAACPQLGPPGSAREFSEDCLSLNIWTPSVDDSTSIGSPCPVYVWIYGGRFLFGAGSDPTFDGSYMASQGVVVVTINYRLGVFGFLAHPELSAEDPHNSSGNYGIHDQLFALRWVRDNVSSFGGDPLNVTIGGQSAGAASCGLHLYSPLSRGLFSRVIVESGMRHPRDPLISGLAPSYRTKERAEAQGVDYVKEKGAGSIAQLRQMSVADLLKGNNRNDDIWGAPPYFRPCIDGHLFPRTYGATLDGGHQADIPVLTGHNNDEGGVYTDERFDAEDYEECINAKFGPLVDRFRKLYPLSSYPDPRHAWNTASRDNSRITLQLWAQAFARHAKAPTFLYHFTQVPPPRKGANPPGWGQPKSKGYTYNKGPMTGAFHGAELWYTFNSFHAVRDRDWTQDDLAVGEQMSAWWLNFIKTGDVNGPPGSGDDPWPRGGLGKVMEIGVRSHVGPLVTTGDQEAKVRFWKDHFARQGEW